MVIERFKPEKMILSDIKDLDGDILDLQHACKGLKINTEITTELEPVDYLILCSGFARNEKIKTFEELEKLNSKIIEQVVNDLKHFIKANTKVIVMTNPVEKMTDLVKKLLPNIDVYNPERYLKSMRNGEELGWRIVKTKGYTSFGPAVSLILLMESLNK
jgi:malate/lactate dehydrogenase